MSNNGTQYVIGTLMCEKIQHFPNKSSHGPVCYNQPMKRKLMDILACPVCKGDLKLTVKEEKADEIICGTLYCPRCNATYSIEDSIPNLLPPKKP